MGRWIQHAAAEGLSRIQAAPPPRNGEPPKKIEAGIDHTQAKRRCPQQHPATTPSGVEPAQSVDVSTRDQKCQTTSLAMAMRQRGGVRRNVPSETSAKIDKENAPNLGFGQGEHWDDQTQHWGSQGYCPPSTSSTAPVSESRRSSFASPCSKRSLIAGNNRGLNILGEFRGFLQRGGPCPREGNHVGREELQHAVVAGLCHWLAAWASSRCVSADQAHLVGAHVPLQPRDGATARGASVFEASFLLDGIEIRARVAVPDVTDMVAAGNGAADLFLVEAWTKCKWIVAGRSVTAASKAKAGRPLEEFLDFVFQAMHKESEESDASWEYESSLEEVDNESGRECTVGAAESFAAWCRERPPLLRFQHCSRGLAWDHPLSKVEKHELLILQIFSQDAEKKREIESVQNQSCYAPSSPCKRRRPKPMEQNSA